MLKSVIMGASLIASAALGSGSASAAHAALAQFQWKQRILLVVGAADDPRRQRQIEALMAEREGLRERDLMVLLVDTGPVRRLDGGVIDVRATDLRRALKIAEDGFQLVLIGKDGGVKERASETVAPSDIFAVIDQMPMRRSEAHRSSPGGASLR